MPDKLLNSSYGIPSSLLEDLTATTGDVLSGKTYLGSDGEVHSGTMTNNVSRVSPLSSVYGETTYFTIPKGAYVKGGSSGYPEVATSLTNIIKGAKLYREVGVVFLRGGYSSFCGILKFGQTGNVSAYDGSGNRTENYSEGNYIKMHFHWAGNNSDYIAAYAKKAGRYILIDNGSISTKTYSANQQILRRNYDTNKGNMIIVGALFLSLLTN